MHSVSLDIQQVDDPAILRQEISRLTQELAIERRRLDDSQRSTGVMSFELDVREGRAWVSDEAFRLLGIEPTTFAHADDYARYLHPEDAAALAETLARHTSTGTTFDIALRCVKHDGSLIVVRCVGEPIFSGEGAVVGFRGTSRDVTHEHTGADVLRDSEERYRLLFQSSPQPMWVYDIESRVFLDVNEAALVRYGYEREEFLSLHLEDIRPPEDVARLQQVFESTLQALTRPSVWRHRWKSGEVRDVLITSHDIEWNARPARLVLPVDVTEQLRAERELREQAALLEKARDGIVLRAPDGTIRHWNASAERIFGYSREEAIGRAELALLRFTEPSKAERAMRDALRLGGWDGELRASARDGRELVLEVSWTLLKEEGQPKPGILSIYTDVTERKRIEAQFLRAQRLESIGTLAGGIAHDLNNMLAPIVLSIELLRGEMPRHEFLETLDTIEQSARRGSDLVRQVLAFARGVDGARVPLSTSVLLDDISRLAHDTFPRSIRIRTELRGPVPAVLGDATQLHQVLLNLCVNARDAMPTGGLLSIVADRIEIDAHHAATIPGGRPGVYVRVSVSDSGTGIPEAIRDRIFEPFFTTKDVNVGTGLGLSTVAAIVRAHGGFVHVYSEPGNGTTFNVYLPAESESAEPEAHAAPVVLPRGRGQLVLVVDDEAAVRSITQQTLEAFGYRTISAADGAAALAQWASRRDEVALVLTDVMMPIMDGPSLARALLHIDSSVRIISASGLNANGGVARAANSGVRRFLPKPYSAETLLRAVHEALEA